VGRLIFFTGEQAAEVGRGHQAVEAEVFRHLMVAVAEEMGVALERTGFSPNIKERRDHSCAVFDTGGNLVAQAAHIPVHLGAFPLMMATLVNRFDWEPGDVVICNDPYHGGTHLPDISMIAPSFDRRGRRLGFVANRAHHADIGGAFPGSMGPGTEIYQEGLIIPPLKLVERGKLNSGVMELLLRNVRTAEERKGDLSAQLAANRTGLARLELLGRRYGLAGLARQIAAARERTARAALAVIAALPSGRFESSDSLDAEPMGDAPPLKIATAVWREGDCLVVEFDGTSSAHRGCLNATLAVTHSAVCYVLISLLPEEISLNQGLFDVFEVRAPAGSLVNAQPPAAVAAGNVETSQRTVDALYSAFAQMLPRRIPAASQGTMNNLTMGGLHPGSGQPWAYYETTGGGAGAAAGVPGASGIHCHMSNTRNTPAEALEYHYPLRVMQYRLRDGSGGAGRSTGGMGVVREVELLAPATATLLTDRRTRGPYGLEGGADGAPGMNEIRRAGVWETAASRTSLRLDTGDGIRISTPGGGGHGCDEP
jgi:N-methylhydantoinase B